MTLRQKIASQFNPETDRVTVVADPDGLLLDELVAEDLRARGFDTLTHDDPVAFRFEYESKYRSAWDRGEVTDESVIIRIEHEDLWLLPYDLSQAGRHVSLSLTELFPRLNYHVVTALKRGHLETLYEAQKRLTSSALGENESADFALKHLFDIDSASIKTDVDLLSTLLRVHYGKLEIPGVLRERLVRSLSADASLGAWPLDTLLRDRAAFFDLLSERWPVFLDREAAKRGGTHEASAVSESYSYDFKYDAPAELPFDHPQVRVYIDNLFSEGLLRRVSHPQSSELSSSWLVVGLKIDPAEDLLRRLDALLKLASNSHPDEEARYSQWLSFAHRWAELKALWFECPEEGRAPHNQNFLELQREVDSRFAAWVWKRYAGLHNQAPSPPVMLHHVPRALAREHERTPQQKMALVLLDGLALDQWVILRNEISRQRPEWTFREQAVFAWVPTLTSISRQALFSGKPPIYFQESLNTTSKEPKLWSQFWGEQGLPSQAVTYAKVVGDTGDITTIDDEALRPQSRVTGIVVAKVDRIMHGEQLGMKGMHEHIKLWARGGFITGLFELLFNRGFAVCLTSDHGNIEAMGIGSPAEGSLAGYRGERVRVFESQALRGKVGAKYPDSVEWPSTGLPDSYVPLLAAARSAFIPQGEVRVSHGGITLEELIVPLVYVTQRAS